MITPRHCRFAVAIALLALGMGSCVSSVPPAPSNAREVPVSVVPTSATTFAGSQHVLARDTAGRLYVAYVKTVDGFPQLFVARSRDDGITWTGFPPVSQGNSASSNPTLIASPDGGMRVFWTKRDILTPEEEQALKDAPSGVVGAGDLDPASHVPPVGEVQIGKEPGDEEDEHIRQIYTSTFDGNGWSPQEKLTRGAYNGFPSGEFDSHGILHLVWYGFDGEFYQILYSRLVKGAWERPTLVSLGFPDSVNPALAVDSRGDVHVAWYQWAPGRKDYQIFYCRRSSDGTWSLQEQVSLGLQVALNVSVAVAPDDTVYVAYEGTLRGDTKAGVYVRSVRLGSWSPQVKVDPSIPEPEEPAVAVNAAGKAFVAFASSADGLIHVATSADWSTSRAISSGGRNGFPNLEPSRAPTRGYAPRPGLVWTQLGADPGNPSGENRIYFATLRE